MKYWPQWTCRVAMDGSGRDPLGLSRVSDALTRNFLLPNIITTTDRARYYSFYTWAIADIEDLRNSKAGRVPPRKNSSDAKPPSRSRHVSDKKSNCQSWASAKWMRFSRQPMRVITWTRISECCPPTRPVDTASTTADVCTRLTWFAWTNRASGPAQRNVVESSRTHLRAPRRSRLI